MARFLPESAASDLTAHRAASQKGMLQKTCAMCGTLMRLSRIEPAQPGYDLRVFECRGCGHAQNFVEKI